MTIAGDVRPTAVTESVDALIGCVAGAVLVSETDRMAKAAGTSMELVQRFLTGTNNPTDLPF